MPILYVNPARARKRRFAVKGKARVGKASFRRRKRRQPSALAAYWAAKRKGRKAKPAKVRRKKRKPVAKKRRRARKGSAAMARRKKRRKSPVKRRRARRTRRLRHKRPGRRRGRKSRRRAAKLGVRRRKRKAGGKRKYKRNPARKARRKRKAGGGKRRARRAKYGKPRRRKARKSFRRRRRAAKRGWRKRKLRHAQYGVAKGRTMFGPLRPKTRKKSMAQGSLKFNPSRRRRRYGRRYRRNPFGGGIVQFLMTAAKKAVPILASLIGIRAVTKLVAPRIPVNLGIVQGPAIAALALVGTKYAAKHVKFLSKYEDAMMIGAGINLVEQLISAFAPANVKGMLGMGGLSDYVAVSDYLQVGMSPPIDDNIALSDYVQVGIDEELGLDQDLGLDQEMGMGDAFGQGGLGGGGSRMLAPVGSQSFLAPVPNRSFTQAVPSANASYDDPDILYTGVFGGGFGG